jgi:hypothetical protein
VPHERREEHDVICPKCGAEYVSGVTVCYDCRVGLVEAAAEPATGAVGPESPRPTIDEGLRAAPQGRFELVPVFATLDPGLLAIAETMLQSAGIPVIVEGARPNASWGADPIGLHHPGGQSLLCVAPQDADDAREILAELRGEG